MELIAHFVNEVNRDCGSRHGTRVRATGFLKGFAMPLIHVSLRAGKPEAYRQAIFDSLYRAMRSTCPKATSS
jgi:hypothetical protein